MEPSKQEQSAGRGQSTIQNLPESVLIRILRRVPQPSRLASAALVCRSWAVAAAAATSCAVIPDARATPERLQLLGAFLAKPQHARDVVEIKVATRAGPTKNRLQLPCAELPKLQSLHLTKCDVQLLSGSGSNSTTEPPDTAAAVLPALSQLALYSSTVSLDTLSCLECPCLTELHLFDTPASGYTGSSTATITGEQLDAALSGLLQRLPGLVQLGLGHGLLSDAALAHLSTLQQLQYVNIAAPKVVPGPVLAQLPSSITVLVVRKGSGILHERDLPAAGLPRLQSLKVSHIEVQPAVLPKFTALERLRLNYCKLPKVVTPDSRVSGAGQLMAALAQLTCLKEIDLNHIYLDPNSVDLAPFSALTASSRLESLKLAYRSRRHPLTQPLPQGAIATMFPPGRQLTALTELLLDAAHPDLVYALQDEDEDLGWDDPFEDSACVDGLELGPLVAACPNLQRLTLNSVVEPDEYDMHQFLINVREQLQGLTYLCLGGLCLTDDVLGRVGDITRLRELELHNAPDVTPAGLEWLLNLRQLSRLVVHGAGCQRCLRFSLKAKATPPDVWQRLQRKLPRLHEEHRFSTILMLEEQSDDDY